MTQKEKQLLLVDLSARLPYKVKGIYQNSDDVLLRKITIKHYHLGPKGMVMTGDIKPYLFPLSSMTEAQRSEYEELYLKHNYLYGADSKYMVQTWKIDWCNRNHFDYRGLIPMGLANDATGLNIY